MGGRSKKHVYLSLSSRFGVVAKALSFLDMYDVSFIHSHLKDVRFPGQVLCFSDFKQPSTATHMPSACTIKMVSGSNWLQWIPKCMAFYLPNTQVRGFCVKEFSLLQKLDFEHCNLQAEQETSRYINCNIARINGQSCTPGEFSWFWARITSRSLNFNNKQKLKAPLKGCGNHRSFLAAAPVETPPWRWMSASFP